MIPVGSRPILWHVMKYYAHFGHKDFILCLGYGAAAIKDFFLRYDECVSNDFILSEGATKVQMLNSDIQDWKLTFIDTGLNANIGQRLKAVEEYIGQDEVFLANYSDGLTDLHLPDQIDHFSKLRKVASLLSVRPRFSTHVILADPDSLVTSIQDMDKTGIRINGGFFIFSREIFSYIRDKEELVHEPFQRLMKEGKLVAYNFDGFWASMDTFKDKQQLEQLLGQGTPPWVVWKNLK